MSITIDIEADLLAKVAAATGGTTSPVPVPMDGIPSYPYAFPVNPSWEGEALDWGQVENTRSHPLLLWWSKSDTARDVWIGHVEAFALAVRTDPTLGGLVTRAWVAEVATDETSDEESVSALVVVEALHIDPDS